MTLEHIITNERKVRSKVGDYGLQACKQLINFHVANNGANLYGLLEEYVNKANNDVFFNKAMVLACWELINEESNDEEEYK